MIRLSLRQFRSQGEVGVAVLLVALVVALLTAHDIVHLYDQTVASCRSHFACFGILGRMSTSYRLLFVLLDALVLVVPALIGVFWGAPLVARELETGTFRLAWTQSVSRKRWITWRLAVGCLGAMAVSGLLSLIVTWWASPIDRMGNPWALGTFSMRGVVPVAYGAFAFCLGVALGAIVRRVMPAMGLTIVFYLAARIAGTYWLRPNLMSPLRKVVTPTPAHGLGIMGNMRHLGMFVNLAGARVWTYTNLVVNKAGKGPSQAFLHKYCASVFAPPVGPVKVSHHAGVLGGSSSAVFAKGPGFSRTCVHALSAHFHGVIAYQPASRYWIFQGLEGAVFLAAAVLLGLLALYWVNRRIT